MNFEYEEALRFRIKLGQTVLVGRYDTTKYILYIEKCYESKRNISKAIDILVDRFNCYDVWVASIIANDIKIKGMRGFPRVVIDSLETRNLYHQLKWKKGGVNDSSSSS